jgi:DNA-binding response OmpR family regulator
LRQWIPERRIGSRPWRALIASRDTALGDLYRSSLESHGWDVEVVPDGQSAWTRAVSSPPDVLLLNSISDVKHKSLLARLRAHEATRKLVVILLANAQQDDEMDHDSDFGVAARLIKSWTTRDKLPDIVGALVERRTTPASSSDQQ